MGWGKDETLDQQDFRRVYELYWEKVFAVCYNHIKKEEIAKGMTQDIFLSLWERRGSLQIHTSIEHYLVKSAKNKVAEYFRNQAIRNKNLNCALKDYCGQSNCTEENVAFSILLQELDILVEQLPCQCQNVFRMSREQGMSNREIANKLGISERAIEYHISKAISFLRKSLPEKTYS